MFQKAFSFVGALLLAGVAVLMMPGVGQAAHGGGGGHFGGGGGHFAGGGHFGYGGFRGGAYHAGARYDGYHHDYDHFHSYYGGYGYYPYYGLYEGYYPYDTAPPAYNSGYYGYYGPVSPDLEYSTYYPRLPAGEYQSPSSASNTTVEPESIAYLTVKVPADAQLSFNGTLTTKTGAIRQFESPPIPAGKYTYDVQARWTENGHEVTQTRQVEVTPGSHVEVDFPTQSQAVQK